MFLVGGDMSGNGSLTRIYIFVLVLNIVFPVLAYTFTSFSEETEGYEISLDPDFLMAAGINLIDAESHNLTYMADWVEYELLNVTLRARFFSTVLIPPGLAFQKQSPIGKAFNSWVFPYWLSVKSVVSNKWYDPLENLTIVDDWTSEFNWSRFIIEGGHHAFVTPYATDNNITKAVFIDGHLNVTIAKSFEADDTSFSFWSFLGWYGSLIIGDQAWGLPPIFSWFIRILAAISIFAIVMLTKDLIRL